MILYIELFLNRKCGGDTRKEGRKLFQLSLTVVWSVVLCKRDDGWPASHDWPSLPGPAYSPVEAISMVNPTITNLF